MLDILHILNKIIQVMEEVETLKKLDGESKRNSVITFLKKNLVQYEKYEQIIPIIIELVIIFSQGKKLKINIKKMSCLK